MGRGSNRPRLAISPIMAKLANTIERPNPMKAMTAANAKNSFGEFLDTVQHEPVVVTKKNRPVGMMLSMQDVKTLFGGDEGNVTRALAEARIEENLATARKQAKDGKGITADAPFFENLRQNIRQKYHAK
jgi:prevent-host-death family protein